MELLAGFTGPDSLNKGIVVALICAWVELEVRKLKVRNRPLAERSG
jgi:hypothetical protein